MGKERLDIFGSVVVPPVENGISGGIPLRTNLGEDIDPTSPTRNRRQLALNVAAGGVANVAKIIIQIIMIPLMARLLGPAEFGLFALGMPTISLLMALADGGLGASMARENENLTVIWSTAFWVLSGIGIILFIVVSGWGLILASMSNEPRLRGLMVFLSLSFPLVIVAVLPSARLIGQRRLFIISGGDLLSSFVGAVVAVALALAGGGVWSLAAQYVVSVAVRAIVFNVAAFVKPTANFDFPSLKKHLSTGSSLLSTRLSEFAGRLVENLVYQRNFGASSLGNYTFANQTPRFICEAVSGPVWAALYAQALHEEPQDVKALHLKITHILSLLIFPAAFLLSGAANEVIDLFLGSQWQDASNFLRILVPFYALSVVAGQSGAIMLANNRGWLLFWIIFTGTSARPIFVALGLWIGQAGVTWGIAATLLGSAVALFLAPTTSKGGSGAALMRATAPPFFSAALAGLVCFLAIHEMPPGFLFVAVGLASGGCCYLFLIAVIEGKQLMYELGSVWRLMGGRRAV